MEITKHKLIMVKEKSFKYDYKLNNSMNTLDFLRNVIKLQQEPEEVVVLIGMNTKNNITGFFEVSRGIIDSAVTSVREIFKRVILSNSKKFILAHNHPSGDTKPSLFDKMFTEDIQQTATLFNIEFLDHLIIGEDDYYSFSEKGLCKTH